eukprot:767284-Hanusia_phi.AAC.7
MIPIVRSLEVVTFQHPASACQFVYDSAAYQYTDGLESNDVPHDLRTCVIASLVRDRASPTLRQYARRSAVSDSLYDGQSARCLRRSEGTPAVAESGESFGLTVRPTCCKLPSHRDDLAKAPGPDQRPTSS